MLITSLLTQELTLANVDGVSKKRVIDTLAQLFSESTPEIDATALFRQFINREKLGSTGIGQGIAIPHCRCASTNKTLLACISLKSAIDFDAVDHEPIDLIFAMVVPENTESEHLELLSSLATRMQDPDYVSALRRAKSSSELYLAASAE